MTSCQFQLLKKIITRLYVIITFIPVCQIFGGIKLYLYLIHKASIFSNILSEHLTFQGKYLKLGFILGGYPNRVRKST
jgi:hypothetical protein